MGSSFHCSQVQVRLGRFPALSDLDLAIGAGERVAFVGPSGAGKTTLLRVLSGSERPTSGRVEVDGVDLASLSRERLRLVRSRLGMIHQDLALVPSLRVVQNVMAGRLGRCGLFGALRTMLRPKRNDLAAVHALLERVGIADKMFQRTDRLSGGQQQRVAVARALWQEPLALLADEPISSVDPTRGRDTVELLVALSKESGTTLVASLHDIALARTLFDRLVGLRNGRVAFDRPSADVAEEDVAALYHLAGADMMADGA